MSDEAKDGGKSGFEHFGRKLDREFGDALPKIEAEVKKVISYLNDKVVPEVRNQSSNALRVASEHLTKLANAMDSHADDQKKP